MSVELVHIYRGNLVESIHRGDIVAVKDREILFSYGDPFKRTFWRSAAKPFQVIPFLEAGGYEKYQLTLSELALMTSSHNGEKEHTDTIRSLFNKFGVSYNLLDCGPARPMYEGAYKEMLKSNLAFSTLNNPCSGKHSSMIGFGLIRNYDLENYINKDHIIQKIMYQTIEKYSEASTIDLAIDGCGVPVFGLPLYNMAVAYEKLAGTNPILSLIRRAMTEKPFYVAGTKRLDTIIMEETKGRILAKLGAESVYAMTILDQGIGIAVKIEDGSYRALNALIADLLYFKKYISKEEYLGISKRLNLTIKNHRDEIVGHYQSIL